MSRLNRSYAKNWLKDFWGIFCHELRQIFSDGGVLLIFLVAGLLYPLLYNVVYLNGILSETPVAIVDNCDSPDSRRFIREIDATREVEVAAKCMNMSEAEKMMQERKVNGIIYFPSDFTEKLARNETSTFSVYADMSSFLYYKNALMATNFVMLHEIGQIQMQRFSSLGMTEQAASQTVKPLGYEDNNPYNRAFSYSFFLISAILMIIIQQTMFYGMSLLVGTARERNHSFSLFLTGLKDAGSYVSFLGAEVPTGCCILPLACTSPSSFPPYSESLKGDSSWMSLRCWSSSSLTVCSSAWSGAR